MALLFRVSQEFLELPTERQHPDHHVIINDRY